MESSILKFLFFKFPSEKASKLEILKLEREQNWQNLHAFWINGRSNVLFNCLFNTTRIRKQIRFRPTMNWDYLVCRSIGIPIHGECLFYIVIDIGIVGKRFISVYD